MRHRILQAGFIGAILLSTSGRAAGRDTAAAGVRLSGSTTVFVNVFEKGQAAIVKDAGVPIDVIANGSRQGLADLAAGRCDIAMISAPIDEVLGHLSEKEKALLSPANVTLSQLAETRLDFIVNESNPVQRLTIKQLSDLFTGTLTNWKDVGGPDLLVQIVSNQFSSGQRAVLEEKVTGGKPVVSTAKSVMNDPLIPGLVRQLKGGLGHASASNDLHGVRVLATDHPITQPMILVTRGKPTERLSRVIAAARKAAVAR